MMGTFDNGVRSTLHIPHSQFIFKKKIWIKAAFVYSAFSNRQIRQQDAYHIKFWIFLILLHYIQLRPSFVIS